MTTAILTVTGQPHEREALAALQAVPAVTSVVLACAGDAPAPGPGLPVVRLASLWDPAGVRQLADVLLRSQASHFVWGLPPAGIADRVGLGRLLTAAAETGAALAYGDFADEGPDGQITPHPLIDYQTGSLRDDFDFGPFLVIGRRALEQVRPALTHPSATRFGGLYDLRLRLSEAGPVVRLSEIVARRPPRDVRTSGERNFDYVNPRHRDYQVEMEAVATAHLERIGGLVTPRTAALVPADGPFPVVASIVVPVRNRVRTVGEAVRSALAQLAPFAFNVLVVDNHSDDGTTGVLAEMARRDPRLIHLVPERQDLGIGGCWNEAVFSAQCGRYAIQLDSDDLYDGTDVVRRIVAEFERGPRALVIGSYSLVDFDLNPIPPGLIDHREWTDDNGPNNALRIMGMGAPRAYHVPTLRTIGFPNASYGEDYAVVLRLCRTWPVGRIYDSLYWCRRWEGNTDSALPLETSNRYHAYKDRLRSIELAARQAESAGAPP